MNNWLAVILADMAVFYAGMRWARHAAKLFVIVVPLLVWSGGMIREAAMAPSEGETAANFVPSCGEDEQCWRTFARQRAQLREGEMARLFAPTAAFFMTLALSVLLVRRARFARRLGASAEGDAHPKVPVRPADARESGGPSLPEGEAGTEVRAPPRRRESDGPRQWWEIEPDEDSAEEVDDGNGRPMPARDEARWDPGREREDA